MKKPSRTLVGIVLLPFVAGCFTVRAAPLPPPGQRQGTEIRGFLVRAEDGGEDERIEFSEVDDVQWREDAVSVVGRRADSASPVPTTSTFPYEELSGVLVRELDAGNTSGLLGGLVVVTVAVITLVITGKTNENTRFPG